MSRPRVSHGAPEAPWLESRPLWEHRETPHRIRYRGTVRRVYAAYCMGNFNGYRCKHTAADVRAIRKRERYPEFVGIPHVWEVHKHEFLGSNGRPR